jgi:uncharacterized protein YfaS (alpha-2-macroglobulin family)
MPRETDEESDEFSIVERIDALGADGRATLAVPTEAKGDVAYSYVVSSDVEDVSGQHIADQSTLIVHPASLYVALSRPPMFVDVKSGATVAVVAVDLNGQAVPGVQVTVSLLREQWEARPGKYGLDWNRREVPTGEWMVRTSGTDTPLSDTSS